MDFLGFDIGGSSIKYGLVGLDEVVHLRYFDVVQLPYTAAPEEYAAAVARILRLLPEFNGVGVGFPRIIIDNQVVEFKTRLDEVWNEVFLSDRLFNPQVQRYAINDADAAGLAEVHRPGAEDLRHGVTIVLTLGTGIGSAIFQDGHLLPNTEMGLIEMYGMEAEKYSAASVKTLQNLSFQDWSYRLQEYLQKLELYLAPNHLVLGGGISADFEQFRPFLHTRAVLNPAHFRNQAGVVGAAMYVGIRSGNIQIK